MESATLTMTENASVEITPYLAVRGAAAAIEFYRRAFGATETMRLSEPGGRLGHAEIRIGTARVMLADENPDYGVRGPEAYGGSPVTIHLYVEDVDAVARRAVAAGARVLRPVEDQFYGDRSGRLQDPFGHVWIVSTRKESVEPAEMQRRMDALMAQAGAEPAGEPAVKPIREGFHAVTPYLIVRKAEALVDFVKRAFGATELLRGTGSQGGLHCEVRIGDSVVMIGGSESMPEESPVTIYLYVPDVDAAYARALQAGGSSITAPADQPYGDRNAGVKDAFGNTWYIATHKKDVAM
jgi:PhnB protein